MVSFRLELAFHCALRSSFARSATLGGASRRRQASQPGLEEILQRELNLPLRARAGVGRALDCAGGGVGQARDREEEVRMVGQVENFGAELERLALGDAEEARNAEVEVVESVAAHDVAPRVAKRPCG